MGKGEIIEYDFFVQGKESQLPREINLDGVEVLGWSKVLGDWWRLRIRLRKSQLDAVARVLKERGLRLARSANYYVP